MDEFDEWHDYVLDLWWSIAPSYVQADVTPNDAHLRDLWGAGATVEQMREALELAFTVKTVTKRRAIYYAYSIVWRQIAGGER